ncbi:hypothetical protein CBM2629_A260081 [Cupriavidus taiwanensis]|nr:hypothetical protein CBM2629_A260081 [Cupriavidus taiwanensis]
MHIHRKEYDASRHAVLSRGTDFGFMSDDDNAIACPASIA